MIYKKHRKETVDERLFRFLGHILPKIESNNYIIMKQSSKLIINLNNNRSEISIDK